MDTHFVVYLANHKEVHQGTLHRYRCQEHHLQDLTVTGTSRRPPYRKQGVRELDRAMYRYGVRCVLLCRKRMRHMIIRCCGNPRPSPTPQYFLLNKKSIYCAVTATSNSNQNHVGYIKDRGLSKVVRTGFIKQNTVCSTYNAQD